MTQAQNGPNHGVFLKCSFSELRRDFLLIKAPLEPQLPEFSENSRNFVRRNVSCVFGGTTRFWHFFTDFEPVERHRSQLKSSASPISCCVQVLGPTHTLKKGSLETQPPALVYSVAKTPENTVFSLFGRFPVFLRHCTPEPEAGFQVILFSMYE